MSGLRVIQEVVRLRVESLAQQRGLGNHIRLERRPPEEGNVVDLRTKADSQRYCSKVQNAETEPEA
jgi:hypothetical protein